MAAHVLPLSVEEFHKLYDSAKPAYEYWYGRAVQKPMPTVLHGIVQALIAMMLESAGWNTAAEVRLKVVSDAEPVPDVIAVQGKFKGRYPATAPALCVEILSPRDTLAKALDKAAQYISWGSQAVWIIDPEKRTAWTLSQESSLGPSWIPPTGDLQIGETTIHLSTLFAEVDKKLELSEDEA
ncbi:MAG: Uma2 family endonuclease [Acidobacteriaceae bacterium]|nr:Uma2 family endonuclease [Acidobacteriaceae bacterium]